MRRIRITLFAVIALLAIVPASALARGHHQRSHRHHVRHARIERFGDLRPSNDRAGTIKSFTDGVLEISLADGSTVRGRVTGDTELECMASMQGDISRDGGDQGGDRNNGSGDDRGSGDGHHGGGDQGDTEGQGDTGDEPEGDQGCSMADLTPGASVHEAELGISVAGAVWRRIELGA